MIKVNFSQYSTGRIFWGRIPHDTDIIRVIKDFCQKNKIMTATFSVSGTVSVFTIGTFDQQQQVYVTSRSEASMEIAACTGNILHVEHCHVQAQIVLADQYGKTVGGRLFSETLVFAGELHLMELLGPNGSRGYDPESGQMLWVPNHLNQG